MLQAAPARPVLMFVARGVTSLPVFVHPWLTHASPIYFAIVFPVFISAQFIIARTFGRPVLIVGKPESDFLREELADASLGSPHRKSEEAEHVVGGNGG